MKRKILLLLFLFLFSSLISLTKLKKKEVEKNFIPIFSDQKKHIKKSYIYELKNKEANDLIKVINLFQDVELKAFENKLIIYANEKRIDELKSIIKELDTMKKQVLVKVKILDVTKDLINRIGLNWNKKYNISLIDFLNLDTENKLKKYKDNGDIRLKIMPSLLVLDNKEGNLNISNLKIKLLPKIKKKQFKKYVELEIELEFKNRNKIEFLKTTVNIDNGKSIYVSSNKFYENYTFNYISKKKESREVYIEIEVNII